MAAEVIDMAGLDAQVSAEVSAENTGAESVDNSEVATQEVETSSEGNEEAASSESESEQKATDGKASAGAAKTDGPVLPKTITAALKSLIESNPDDPTVKSAAKQLREAFFSSQALTKEFGSLTNVRNMRGILDEVAGTKGATLEQVREAHANTQGLISNIKETDALVHAGDSQIWKNIVEDLKSEGHIDSLPKLVVGGLDTLKAHSQNEYEAAILPHFVSGLEQTGVPEAIRTAYNFLTQGNSEKALKVLKDSYGWYADLKKNVDEAKKANQAEVQANSKLEQYKAEQAKAETKTFRESVARECESYNNKSLGAALKPFLKMPFFKDFPRETLVDLGNGIKERLYRALEGDSGYQNQMKGQWKQKTPDKGKITEFHKTTLDGIAAKIVEETIKQRYPGYAKGGTAAGRVAAAKAKSDASAQASAQSVTSGKPIYVASKPKDLVRNPIVVGGKQYGLNDLQLMEITGRGFVKSTNGAFKLVTWRRS